MSRRRRTAVTLAAGVLTIAAAAVVTGGAVGADGRDGSAEPGTRFPVETAKVTRQTLIDRERADGTLGYGRESGVSSRLAGTVTALAEVGTIVRRGQRLYTVDNTPVVLLYGALPAYRALAAGVEGPDVKQFETELRALGYQGFRVDSTFGEDTAAAVRKWQRQLGSPQTGAVELGRVLFAPGEVRVAAHKVQLGDPAAPGVAVLTTSGTTRLVVVKLDMNDLRLAKREGKVTVEMPDGKTIEGTVSQVVTIVEQGNGQGEAKTRLEVTVALGDATAAAAYDQASVGVRFTAEQRENVLTVPVAALLALLEGGYGVQIVQGGTTRIVAVEVGLFASGRVEVSGADITEGAVVGMAS